jgi:hypothetical protein
MQYQAYARRWRRGHSRRNGVCGWRRGAGRCCELREGKRRRPVGGRSRPVKRAIGVGRRSRREEPFASLALCEEGGAGGRMRGNSGSRRNGWGGHEAAALWRGVGPAGPTRYAGERGLGARGVRCNVVRDRRETFRKQWGDYQGGGGGVGAKHPSNSGIVPGQYESQPLVAVSWLRRSSITSTAFVSPVHTCWRSADSDGHTTRLLSRGRSSCIHRSHPIVFSSWIDCVS